MKISGIMKYANVHSVSKLFQPVVSTEIKGGFDKLTCRSQKLMLRAGIIHQAQNGLFHLLPLAVRALKKLTGLVEYYMDNSLNAQKISIPSLTSKKLWDQTGRMELAGLELFKVRDRHNKEFILAPTHEESITKLMAMLPLISYRALPLLLYQISNKYRDEMRPRFGLIRSKEFLMKDLYTFDTNNESSLDTYHKVCETYEKIFNQLGVNYLKVAGENGLMGGSLSHEYHYPAEIGDDTLVKCEGCNSIWNKNLYKNEISNCTNCSSSSFCHHKGIEVGHTFLLGTKYSSVLKAQYDSDSQHREDLYMGSYGLGLTRLIGAALEVLSSDDGLRWPDVFAPYSIVIIPPKGGSKEEAVGSRFVNLFCEALDSIDYLKDDVLVDDRIDMTIGRRLLNAKFTGYPNIIVVGKGVLKDTPMFEYHKLSNGEKSELSFDSLIDIMQSEYGSNDKYHVSPRINVLSYNRSL